MKKRASGKKYLPIALALAAFATVGMTSAFAQAYGPYGSGNIAPNVTQANPDGIFRYPFSTNDSGRSAYAQAPATIHRRAAHRRLVVTPSPR
jgi:hypothetical protein